MSQDSFETRGYLKQYSNGKHGVTLTLVTELSPEQGKRLILSDAYRIILKIDLRERPKK